MASALEERTYSIATLPKPFDRDHGRTQVAAVQSIRASKKRKRHEVVVGIDGESLNVYNVRSQNLLASYALPPQTLLCCPPYSVYSRTSKSVPAQRRTYAVLRDGVKSKRHKLVCFTENVAAVGDGGELLHAAIKTEHELEAQDIVGLDVLPSHAAETGDQPAGLLITCSDGRTTCLLPDLSSVAWTGSAVSDDAATLDFSMALDADEARKGLLLSREDVLGSLQSGSGPPGNHTLLLQMVHTTDRSRVLVSAVRTPTSDHIQTHKAGLRLIMDYDIPTTAKKIKRPSYDFHAGTGKLYQLNRGRLTVHDLSGIVPTVQFRCGNKLEPVTSFTRVSASSVLAVIGEQARIYETRYGSVQRVLTLQPRRDTPTLPTKRKLADHTGSIPAFHSVTFFSELGLLVGINESELSVCPIMAVETGPKRMKTGSTELADIHANRVDLTALKVSRGAQKAKLERWLADFDLAVENHDIAEAERLAAKALRLKAIEHDSQYEAALDGNDVDLASFDILTVDKRRVLHIICKCFKPGRENEHGEANRLTIVFGSVNIFRWLALAGFLDQECIQQAFACGNTHASFRVLPGDLMKAISRFDDEFSLMFELLALPSHWNVEEVVQALQLLAQSFETATDDGQLALPAPPSPSVQGDDTPMTNGDIESHLELESRVAQKEFDHAMSTLDSGLRIRSDAFRLTLQRLHAFPAKAVTAAMRSAMSHRQLIFFIHIMRIELSDGGWIIRYADFNDDDSPPAQEDEVLEPDNRAIKAIADVLNCAIDAVGTSGWLVGLSGTAINAEELISALRAEINACLEGSYEAVNLDTMIDELERYTAIAHEAGTMWKKGQHLGPEEAKLPVGLRSEAPAVHGRVNQSALGKKAHIRATEKNRKVGRYTFERIRI